MTTFEVKSRLFIAHQLIRLSAVFAELSISIARLTSLVVAPIHQHVEEIR